MDVQLAVAHAISEEFDIAQAFPRIFHLPVHAIEIEVAKHVGNLHKRMSLVIESKGEPFIKKRDAVGLASLCRRHGVKVPPDMLQRMCQQIVDDLQVTARPVLAYPEWNKARDVGNGMLEVPRNMLWYVKMDINLSE